MQWGQSTRSTSQLFPTDACSPLYEFFSKKKIKFRKKIEVWTMAPIIVPLCFDFAFRFYAESILHLCLPHFRWIPILPKASAYPPYSTVRNFSIHSETVDALHSASPPIGRHHHIFVLQILFQTNQRQIKIIDRKIKTGVEEKKME